jgi:progesterone-induced-blocking factor 1
MLREKVNLLKGEFYKSEATAKDNLSSLKAQVAVMREQLANYELIEKEIDEAVVSLSSLKPSDNNVYLNTLNSVPTANRRRIQQALGLAQRLQAKQRELDEASGRLESQSQ